MNTQMTVYPNVYFSLFKAFSVNESSYPLDKFPESVRGYIDAMIEKNILEDCKNGSFKAVHNNQEFLDQYNNFFNVR